MVVAVEFQSVGYGFDQRFRVGQAARGVAGICHRAYRDDPPATS